MSSPHRYVEMIGRSDPRFDRFGALELALNPRPERCATCSFPNIDVVPGMYRLPYEPPPDCEAWPAALGNFFVKRRARAILETVAPGQCRLHPTHHPRHLGRTDWWLACPVLCVPEAVVDPSVPRCPSCREPKVASKSLHFRPLDREPCPLDVFSAREWHSAELTAEEADRSDRSPGGRDQRPPAISGQRWTRPCLDRTLFFSIRMQLLFRHAGIVGIGRAPTERQRSGVFDRRWVMEQLALLRAMNLVGPSASSKSRDASSAFDTEDLPFLPPDASKSVLSSGQTVHGVG